MEIFLFILMTFVLMLSCLYILVDIKRIVRYFKGGQTSIMRREKTVLKKSIQRDNRKCKMEERRKESRRRKTEQREEMINKLSIEERDAFYEKEKESKKKRAQNMDAGLTNGLKIAIDLSFPQATDKDITSLARQLGSVHNFNKKVSETDVGLSVYLTNFKGGKIKEVIESCGGLKWKMIRRDENVHEIFSPDRIVYLSPDATDPLIDVEKDKIYVIGGIVDRSVVSKLTLNRSNDLNIISRRLPLSEFMPQVMKRILNIDNVVSILHTFYKTKDWKETFEIEIPLRKRNKVITKRNVAYSDLDINSMAYSELKNCNFKGKLQSLVQLHKLDKPVYSNESYKIEGKQYHESKVYLSGFKECQAKGRVSQEAQAKAALLMLCQIQAKHGIKEEQLAEEEKLEDETEDSNDDADDSP